MRSQILKLCIVVGVVLGFSGCVEKKPAHAPEPQVEQVQQPIKKKTKKSTKKKQSTQKAAGIAKEHEGKTRVVHTSTIQSEPLPEPKNNQVRHRYITPIE